MTPSVPAASDSGVKLLDTRRLTAEPLVAPPILFRAGAQALLEAAIHRCTGFQHIAARDVFRRVDEMRDEAARVRSEEHTSELQSLMRISYAVFCLKKKNNK